MLTDEMGSVPPPELVNASRQRILRTPANEASITTAVQRERLRSRGIARELELTQPRLLEVLTITWTHTTRITHTLFADDPPSTPAVRATTRHARVDHLIPYTM